MFTNQGRRKIWKSGGARNTVWGECALPGWDRVNWSAKNWEDLSPPQPPLCDRPALNTVLDRSILHCKAKVCVFSKIYDGKIINIPYRNVYQRTWKLVDCKIYNSSTRGKSIQNQSTTPFGRCGLTLDWFTTREIVIDFAIHQLLGPLITPGLVSSTQWADFQLWIGQCSVLSIDRVVLVLLYLLGERAS